MSQSLFGSIYLITCLINSKKYIGQHKTTNPIVRWKDHIRQSIKGSKNLLHSAIRKYRVENFRFERVCICPLNGLGNMEQYYAEQYGCYMWDPEPGYNMVWCGKSARLGLKNSPEAIERSRLAHIGMKHTPETKEKIRQGGIGRKCSLEAIEKTRQSHIGMKHTPEAIEKMRKTHSGKVLTQDHIVKLREALILARSNQINKTGHKNIYKTRSNTWQVQISCKKTIILNRTLPTLEEAIKVRDAFINQNKIVDK